MVPEISVILPFYNAENTLEISVESVLKQGFFDFELLLVDNCSDIRSTRIAQGLAKREKRIHFLEEPKAGVANAMNCGLIHARGKFIARMDVDDISHPERLEKQLRYLKENL